MSIPPPLSAAVNRLWLPRPALGTCVRAAMSRDTSGVALPPERRFNHFPATPLCTLTWWLAGDCELLAPGAAATLATPRTPLAPRILFSGPRTGPTVSWNPGPCHGIMLLLMPDALQRLTGIDVSAWVDEFVDAKHVLPTPWFAMAQAVRDAADDEARVALMQDFIEPLWTATRPTMPLQLHRYTDWAQSLAMRAATSAPGRSLRQVERRIKQWAGLPMRELRGISRLERAFFAGVADAQAGGAAPRWAEVAEIAGYADQSHLCRETRRLTGFAPAELYRRIAGDEGFWSYRIWM